MWETMQVQVLSSAPDTGSGSRALVLRPIFLCPRQCFARVVGRSTRKDSEGVRRQGQSARHVQTRMIQVHVGNHAGSSPVIRTRYRKWVEGVGSSTYFFMSTAMFCSGSRAKYSQGQRGRSPTRAVGSARADAHDSGSNFRKEVEV